MSCKMTIQDNQQQCNSKQTLEPSSIIKLKRNFVVASEQELNA